MVFYSSYMKVPRSFCFLVKCVNIINDQRSSFEWYVSLTLAVDMMRVQALAILLNTFMVAMVLSVPSPLIEFEESHTDHNDITEEEDNLGYQFHGIAGSIYSTGS